VELLLTRETLTVDDFPAIRPVVAGGDNTAATPGAETAGSMAGRHAA
jgi:hypothetical protein